MDWLKLDADFVNDPKMRRYFTKSERTDWVSLLCLASKSKERGVIHLPNDEIAYALELEDEEWEALCQKFMSRRMVHRREDGALVVTNFAKRQAPDRKPSDMPQATAERKRIQRTRQREQKEQLSRPVTPCHAIEENRIEENRIEENRIEENRRDKTSSPLPTIPILTTDDPPTPQTGGGSVVAESVLTDWQRERLPQTGESPTAYVKRALILLPGHWREDLQKRFETAHAAGKVGHEFPWKRSILVAWVLGKEPPPEEPKTYKVMVAPPEDHHNSASLLAEKMAMEKPRTPNANGLQKPVTRDVEARRKEEESAKEWLSALPDGERQRMAEEERLTIIGELGGEQMGELLLSKSVEKRVLGRAILAVRQANAAV